MILVLVLALFAGLVSAPGRDRGSNVLSKGHDGFTPVGPRIAAADVDLRVSRWIATAFEAFRRDGFQPESPIAWVAAHIA